MNALESLLLTLSHNHVDTTLRVVQQVQHVGTGGRMDRHTLAAGDVAHNLLAPDRVAAACPEHHQIVEALDLDRFFPPSEDAAHHRLDGRLARPLFELLLWYQLGEHSSG